MPGRKSFYRSLCGIAIVLCVWCAPFSPALRAESPSADSSAWERQLTERSRAYLESIRRRAAEQEPEQRETMTRQARNLVEKGFAKLNHPSKSMRTQRSAPVDLQALSESFQKIPGGRGNPSIMKAVAFLDSNFQQPSERDVALCVALPFRFSHERRPGLFAVSRPVSGPVFGFPGFGSTGCCDMIVVPSSLRSGKTWSTFLGRHSFSTLSDPCVQATAPLSEAPGFLSGFPLIARTIVLRI